MALLHTFEAMARGGVPGIQALHRDFSPFVAHFTSFKAMIPVQDCVKSSGTPKAVAKALKIADTQSFQCAKAILETRTIRASTPSAKDGLPRCVCLSESTLPGLVAHAERYGRFGFVFRKTDVFKAKGRPCLYLAENLYTHVDSAGEREGASALEQELRGLSNMLCLPGFGKVQDYTHEREWRVLSDVRLDETRPVAVVSPSGFVAPLRPLLQENTVQVPIDVFFEWGI